MNEALFDVNARFRDNKSASEREDGRRLENVLIFPRHKRITHIREETRETGQFYERQFFQLRELISSEGKTDTRAPQKRRSGTLKRRRSFMVASGIADSVPRARKSREKNTSMGVDASGIIAGSLALPATRDTSDTHKITSGRVRCGNGRIKASDRWPFDGALHGGVRERHRETLLDRKRRLSSAARTVTPSVRARPSKHASPRTTGK